MPPKKAPKKTKRKAEATSLAPAAKKPQAAPKTAAPAKKPKAPKRKAEAEAAQAPSAKKPKAAKPKKEKKPRPKNPKTDVAEVVRLAEAAKKALRERDEELTGPNIAEEINENLDRPYNLKDLKKLISNRGLH